jgi:methionyl-tRNA formyltransferase
MVKGSQLVLRTVRSIEQGKYPSIPQTESAEIKHAPKIFKETCQINWNQSSEQIRNFVRGLNPYPTAWCELNGKTYKVFKVSVPKENGGQNEIGIINTDNKNYLHIRTSDGWISIDELQPEGKRRMDIKEFFRGNKIN